MKVTGFALAALTAWTISLTGCHSHRVGSVADLCSAKSSTFSDVLGRIASGSESDAISAVRSLSCLDGGNLEDAHIAIGEAAFKFPKKIAPLLQSASVGSNDLIAIATMLPPEYVDEPCESRDELTNRRMQISQDTAFSFARAIVLQQLDSSIAKQNQWCKEVR